MDAAVRYFRDAGTLKDALVRTLTIHSHRVFSQGLSYAKLHRDVAELASFLERKGVTFVGIIGDTSLDWLRVDLAAALARVPSVGLHAEWPQSDITHVLKDAGVQLLLILPIASGSGAEVARLAAAEAGIEVMTLDQVRDAPRAVTELPAALDSYMVPYLADPSLASEQQEDEDNRKIYTLMYTSGTSGPPKGVPTLRGAWKDNSVQGLGGDSISPRIICLHSMAHGSDRYSHQM